MKKGILEMRKLQIISITSFLALLLSACSDLDLDAVLQLFQSDEEMESVTGEIGEVVVADDQEQERSEEAERAESSGLPAMEVYQRALSAAEEIDSVQMLLEIEQEGMIDGQDLYVLTNIDMEANYDPFIIHQSGVSAFDIGGGSMHEMDFEVYMTEEDIYYYVGLINKWINLNGPMSELMDEAIEVEEYPSPYEQLKVFKKNLDKVSLSESGDQYVLTLAADESTLSDVLQEVLEPYSQENLNEWVESGDFLAGADIDRFIIEMYVNKDDFIMTHFVMDMVFHFSDGDSLSTIGQMIKGEYSKINEVGKIEIPAEVKEDPF